MRHSVDCTINCLSIVQAGRRSGMRATLVSFLEQSPLATSDIIGHMTISFVIHAVLRYGHSKFSKMAASRHLGLGATRSRSIRSAVPENPT